MSPSAPKSIWEFGNLGIWKSGIAPATAGAFNALAVASACEITKFPNFQISKLLARSGRHEQVRLVPDEVLVAVHRELVVLAHEDRRDRAGLFTVSAEDAARLVDLVGLRVARPRLDGAVVFRRLEVNRVRRARDGAQTARHAFLQPVLVAHQDLLAAPLRERRDFLVGIVDGDFRLEEMLQRGRKAEDQGTNHAAIISGHGSQLPVHSSGVPP